MEPPFQGRMVALGLNCRVPHQLDVLYVCAGLLSTGRISFRIWIHSALSPGVGVVILVPIIRRWRVNLEPASIPQEPQGLRAVVDQHPVGVVAVLTLHRQVEHMTHGVGVGNATYQDGTLIRRFGIRPRKTFGVDFCEGPPCRTKHS